jgi:hypothetical protein
MPAMFHGAVRFWLGGTGSGLPGVAAVDDADGESTLDTIGKCDLRASIKAPKTRLTKQHVDADMKINSSMVSILTR